MIASMYQRRMKAAFIISIVIFLIAVGVILIDWPDSSDDWLTIFSIGMVGLFMGTIAFSSRKKYIDVKDIHIPRGSTSVMELDHLVLKKDVGFFPRLLLFEKQGRFIGTVKPLKIPYLLYPVSLVLRDSLIMMLPISYGVFSNDDSVMLTLKRRGIKQSTVTVKDTQGERLGEYVQKDFKSLVKVQGELRDASGEIILPVEIKGFSGDFTLKDKEGRQWAHFYNGYFPHEYTKVFRDVGNDIVDLKDDLPENHKILLVAMISYVFLERSQ
ncbi:hypothetical protein [Bacillus piscicola]|uniref:hypothetical protein n=1 Tax=Bacillus piscicola TaxID=1632684 RepID=UPI001F090A2D|nr:hypothetical protein [Bacillus piscicola]